MPNDPNDQLHLSKDGSRPKDPSGASKPPPLPSGRKLSQAERISTQARRPDGQTADVDQQAEPPHKPQTASGLPEGIAVKIESGGIIVLCPYCQAKLKFNPQLAGRPVKCSRCNKQFRFPARGQAATGSTPRGRVVTKKDLTQQVSPLTADGPSTSSKSESRPSEIESALRECHGLAKRSNLPFKLRNALTIGQEMSLMVIGPAMCSGGILGVLWLARITNTRLELGAFDSLVLLLQLYGLPVLILGLIAIGLTWAIVITLRPFMLRSLFDYFTSYSNLPYTTPWRLESLVPPSQRIKAQEFRLLDQLAPSVGNYSTKNLKLGVITETDVAVAGRVATCTVPINKANESLLPVATMTLNAVQSRVGDWYLVLPEAEELKSSLNVLRPLPVDPPGELTMNSERKAPYAQAADQLPAGIAVMNKSGDINVLCPYCEANLKFNPQLAGRAAKCSKCKEQFRFPEKAQDRIGLGSPGRVLIKKDLGLSASSQFREQLEAQFAGSARLTDTPPNTPAQLDHLIDKLESALLDQKAEVVAEALRELARIGPPSVRVLPSIAKRAVPKLQMTTADGSTISIGQEALITLGAIGPAAIPAIEKALKSEKRKNIFVRELTFVKHARKALRAAKSL